MSGWARVSLGNVGWVDLRRPGGGPRVLLVGGMTGRPRDQALLPDMLDCETEAVGLYERALMGVDTVWGRRCN